MLVRTGKYILGIAQISMSLHLHVLCTISNVFDVVVHQYACVCGFKWLRVRFVVYIHCLSLLSKPHRIHWESWHGELWTSQSAWHWRWEHCAELSKVFLFNATLCLYLFVHPVKVIVNVFTCMITKARRRSSTFFLLFDIITDI